MPGAAPFLKKVLGGTDATSSLYRYAGRAISPAIELHIDLVDLDCTL